jgi:hypothetical protein
MGAATPPEGEVEDVLAVVAAATPDTVAAAASVPTTGDGTDAIDATVSGVDVAVPSAAQDGIAVSDRSREVSIGLPFADRAGPAEVLGDGVVSYDNDNGSTTVPIVLEDGSVQVNTVIEDASAPTRFAYELGVPQGGSVTLEEGMVLVRDAEGAFVAIAAPAWAKDAGGADVPTRYELSGSTLTQVVDHAEGTTAYPVVADPRFGIQLFAGFKRDTYGGDYRYSAWVTGLGAVVLSGGGGVGGYLAGQAVFKGAGWDEWKSKWPAVTNKATLKQQYDCHVAASVYGLPFTQDYNLERFRANRSNWTSGVVSHRCNW